MQGQKRWRRTAAGWMTALMLLQSVITPLTGWAFESAQGDAGGSPGHGLLTDVRLVNQGGQDMNRRSVEEDIPLRLVYTYDFGALIRQEKAALPKEAATAYEAEPDSQSTPAESIATATAAGASSLLPDAESGVWEYHIELPGELEYDIDMELLLAVLDEGGFKLEDHTLSYEPERHRVHMILDKQTAGDYPTGTIEVPVRLSSDVLADLGVFKPATAVQAARAVGYDPAGNTQGHRIEVSLGGEKSRTLLLLPFQKGARADKALMDCLTGMEMKHQEKPGAGSKNIVLERDKTVEIEVKTKEHSFDLRYDFVIDDLEDRGFEKNTKYQIDFPDALMLPDGTSWEAVDENKDHWENPATPRVIGDITWDPSGKQLTLVFRDDYYDEATDYQGTGGGFRDITFGFDVHARVNETLFTQKEIIAPVTVAGGVCNLKLSAVQEDLTVKLSKTGRVTPENGRVTQWAVTLTGASIGAGYQLTDQLDSSSLKQDGAGHWNQEMIRDSFQFSELSLIKDTDYTIQWMYDNSESQSGVYITGYKLTFLKSVPLASGELVIGYKSQVPDDYYWEWVAGNCKDQNNAKEKESVSVKNTARLTYLDRSEQKSASVTETIYSPLIKSVEKTDKDRGEITWKLELNKGGGSLEANTTVAEVIGNGMELTGIRSGTDTFVKDRDWETATDTVNGDTYQAVKLKTELNSPAVLYVDTKITDGFTDTDKGYGNQVCGKVWVNGEMYTVWSVHVEGKLPGGAGVFTKYGQTYGDIGNAWYSWTIHINQNRGRYESVRVTDDMDGAVLLDAAQCNNEVIGLEKINPDGTSVLKWADVNSVDLHSGSVTWSWSASSDFGETASPNGDISLTYQESADHKSSQLVLDFGQSQAVGQYYVLHFKTAVRKLQNSSLNGTFSNQARMERKDSAGVTISSNPLDQRGIKTEKTAHYNKETNEFTWTLTSNRDGKTLTNPLLYDHFPAGYAELVGLESGRPLPDTMSAKLQKQEGAVWMDLTEGADYWLEIIAADTSGNGSTSDPGVDLVFHLGGADSSSDRTIDYTVRAVITGVLRPEAIQNWETQNLDQTFRYTNTGYLESEDYGNAGSGAPTLGLKPLFLKKQSEYIVRDEQIEWSVLINPEGYILTDAAALIEDEYDIDCMRLLPDTMTLYRQDYDGSLADQGLGWKKVEFARNDLTYDDTTGSFSFKLPLEQGDFSDKGYSYKLTYRTDVFKPSNPAVGDSYLYQNQVHWQIGATPVTYSAEHKISQATVNRWGGAKEYKRVRVLKLDVADHKPLAGASFRMSGTMSNGADYNKTSQTDSNGVLYFTKMRNGTYMLEETSPPAGYDGGLFQPESFEVVETDSEFHVTAYNNRDDTRVHSLEFVKKAYDGTTVRALEGITFTLTSKTSGISQKAVSQENGSVSFNNLVPGDYVLHESNPPAGYKAMEDQIITIDGSSPDAVRLADVVNMKQTARLEFRKLDGKGAPLPGGEFTLFQHGQAVQTVLSDADGWVRFDGLYDGTYVIKETAAPEGYVPPDPDSALMIVTITLDMLGTTLTEQSIINTLKPPARISLLKTDDSKTPAPLSGAVFGLYRDNMLLMEAVSDENGLVRFDVVEMGTCSIRELHPPKGYTGTVAIEGIEITASQMDTDIYLGAYMNELSPVPNRHSGGGNSGGGGGGVPSKPDAGTAQNPGPGVPKNPEASSADLSPESEPENSPGQNPMPETGPHNSGDNRAVPGPGDTPTKRVDTSGKSREEILQYLEDGFIPLGNIPSGMTRAEMLQWILDNEIPLYAPLPKTGRKGSGAAALFWTVATALMAYGAVLLGMNRTGLRTERRYAQRRKRD